MSEPVPTSVDVAIAALTQFCYRSVHVYRRPSRDKRCACGRSRNAAYRSLWQRRKDRRQFNKMRKAQS